MADSYLSYQNPTTTNKKLDSESLTVGANTVERERIQISGTAATDIAAVSTSSVPSATAGLIVRNIEGTITTVSNVVTGSIQLDPLSHVTVTNIKGGTINTLSTLSSLTTGSIQLDPKSHVTVQNIKGGTINTLASVSNIVTGSIQLDPLSHVTVQNIKEGTITTVGTVSSLTTGSVQLDPLSSITSIQNVNDGTISTVSSITTGSIQLDPLSHVTVQNIKGGTITTLATVSSLTSGSVQLMASGALIGTVSVVPTLMKSTNAALTAAGTAVVVALVSGKKIKVYAMDISTTATASYNEVNFYDGVTGGTILFMFGLVNATSNCLAGIAKSVTPPAYLFTTSPGNALLVKTSASEPVNYNISYWAADAV